MTLLHTRGAQKSKGEAMAKATCLVVVTGGVAYYYHAEHVDCTVIDLDNIKAGDEPVPVPAGIGYEALLEQAELEQGTHYTLFEVKA
jgi:hypothetical protein